MRNSLILILPLVVFFAAVTAESQNVTQSTYVQYKVNPAGTFFVRDSVDNNVPPTTIAVGAGTDTPAGTALRIRSIGQYKNIADPSGPDIYSGMIGVFKGPSGYIHPAPGTNQGGIYTTPTCIEGHPTDIAQDFYIPEEVDKYSTVVVPAGATQLLLSPADCYFIDNSDPNNDYYVRLIKDVILDESEKAKKDDNQNDDSNNEAKSCNRSTISIDSQVLAEAIDLPKTGLSLHYSSDRVVGYRTAFRLKVPVTGGSDMRTNVYVAGRSWNNIGATPNYEFLLDWDGLDNLGNPVPSPRSASVLRFPVNPPPGTWYGHQEAYLGVLNAKLFGFGGWTLNDHHYFDRYNGRLFRGTGDSQAASTIYLGNTSEGIARYGVASSDGSEVYEFNLNNGRHLKTLNGKTGQTLKEFFYDSNGLLIEIRDAFTNSVTIARSGSQITITGPYGHVNTLTVDTNGYLSSVEQPSGQTYLPTHMANGLLSTLQKPRGDVHNFTYDTLGRLVTDQGPLGRILNLTRASDDLKSNITRTTSENRSMLLSFARDSYNNYVRTEVLPHGESVQSKTSHNINEVTSSDGTLSLTQLQDHPRLGFSSRVPAFSKYAQPSGLANESTFNRWSALTNYADRFSITTEVVERIENGRLTRSEYTGSTRTTVNTSPTGRTSNYTIDEYGRLTREEKTGINAILSYYDTRGRLNRTVQGDRETIFTYDTNGNLATVEDPLGRTTTMSYDSSGRLTQATRPDTQNIAFTYDTNSNLTSITPPGRVAHEMVLDALNRLVDMFSPNLNGSNPINLYKDHFNYNTDNEVTKITRADNSILDFKFEPGSERLERVQTPNGDYQYSYLPNSKRVATVSSPYNVLTVFSYDGSLVTQVKQAGPVKGAVYFSYDNFFNVLRSRVFDKDDTVKSISDVEYTYDNDGLLTAAGPLTITRNIASGMITQTTAGSITDSRTYNGFGEVTEYQANYRGSLLYSYTLTRDKLGRITKKIENIGGEEKIYDYVYDLAGRLTEVKTDGVVTGSYTYDANGARTLTADNGHSHVGTFDAQDRMTSLGSLQFTYKDSGELMTRTDSSISETVNYTYDTRGNLTQATLPGSCTISYVTDGLDRQVAKKYNGNIERQLVFENQLRVAATLDKNGVITQRYVYGTMSHSPDLILESGKTYRVITDHLGSIRLIVRTSNGEITRVMNHDAWGRVTQDTNPRFSPFGFAGGIYDSDTKLVRFGARDYNPEVGRWTAKDPISFKGGDTNLYGYVLNNPLNFIDPRGTDVVINYYGGGSGHIGVSVNNGQSRGYYGGYKSPSSALSGANGEAAVLYDLPIQGDPTKSVTIPATPEQDAAVEKYFDNKADNPGEYNLYTNNCATNAGAALKSAGLKAPNTRVPILFINQLQGRK